jgi:hypothetical protein
MPSISAANAMIVEQRIEEGIKKEFSPEVQPDVHKMLRLMSEGGDRYPFILLLLFGPFIVFLSFSLSFALGAYVSILLLVGAYLMWRLRKKFQRELGELLASNPVYWRPISEKLVKIVLEAGKISDGFWPRQVTRIVRS